jgi:two-component sensor histidine kinase
MDDREMLIRVEQQMQDASKYQVSIMSDLKEIFHRIENDSKIVSQLRGETDTYMKTFDLRLADIERRFVEKFIILKELQDDLSKEKQERSTLQNELNGTLKTIKWMFSIIAVVATIVNVAISFLK